MYKENTVISASIRISKRQEMSYISQSSRSFFFFLTERFPLCFLFRFFLSRFFAEGFFRETNVSPTFGCISCQTGFIQEAHKYKILFPEHFLTIVDNKKSQTFHLANRRHSTVPIVDISLSLSQTFKNRTHSRCQSYPIKNRRHVKNRRHFFSNRRHI